MVTKVEKKRKDGEFTRITITLPDAAVEALKRFTKSKTGQEAIEKCVLMLDGQEKPKVVRR